MQLNHQASGNGLRLTDAVTAWAGADYRALAAAGDDKWVWGGGAGVLVPDYFCVLADASVVREFDLITRRFVSDGVDLLQANSDISWEDENTVLVGTDFGDGSPTDSGDSRLVKLWRLGTPFGAAETAFFASSSDVLVTTCVSSYPRFARTFNYCGVNLSS